MNSQKTQVNTPVQKYKNWRKLTAEEIAAILDAVKLLSRREVQRIYNITEGQLCRLLRDDAKRTTLSSSKNKKRRRKRG